jgi:hypothetical protein
VSAGTRRRLVRLLRDGDERHVGLAPGSGARPRVAGADPSIATFRRREDPRAGGAARRIVAVGAVPDAEKRVLHDVLGRVGVSDHPSARPKASELIAS